MRRVLVLKEKKALVIVAPEERGQLLQVLDKPTEFRYKGKQLITVPHTLWNSRMLTRMNFQVPSPIAYQYDWPGRYTPKHHQIETAAFLTLHQRGFVLNSIGTGKTLSALWAADYLMKLGEVQRAVIVSPLSTLERVWGDEIFNHFPHRTFEVLHASANKRRELLNKKADFYIINHDGLQIIVDQLMQRPDINLLIGDEFAVYRNARTTRYEILKAYTDKMNGSLLVWGMTATPTPNEPSDAWAQCRIIEPSRVPKYYKRFKESVMQQVSTYTWVPRDNATDTVKAAMQPAIRFTRDECLDLPPTIYQNHSVELTPDQRKVYNQMAEKLYIQVGEGEVTAMNEAIKLNKLVQIACGAVYNNDGGTIHFESGPRLRLLVELIEQAGEKVIVFAPLIGVLHKLREEVGKHWSCACIEGSVSKDARSKIFSDFQKKPDPHVLIAHPRTMSHGLTLTEATTIIWYAPYSSAEIYEQANGRIAREGQTKTTNIIHVSATPIERRMYSRLANKQKLQGLLLDAVKEMRQLIAA